jgi:hypothetical protein
MAGDGVALAIRGVEAGPAPIRTNRRTNRWPTRLLVAGVVALAASPIVVAALSLVGDSWFPTGDWAGLVFRTSQVGTGDTPLVGFDSVKGWAHPGPLLFWIAAPLYRLTGGDPRSLAWTAAIVNCLVVAGLAAVAWRRGRWPLLVGTMAFFAVLLHGITPTRTVDLWVSHLPLLAFLLTVFLAWDIALGRPSTLVAAAAVASFTAQTHLAYASLNGLLAAWLVAWCLGWPRLLPLAPGDTVTAELPQAPWTPWHRALRRALVMVVVLWIGPLVDAVFDLHNPWNIARSFGAGASRVGLVQAIGLVGRYVRPDGPWVGGAEPMGGDFLSVQGSGVLPVLLALGALAWCLRIGRRRRLPDVVALATLALVLVIGAVPAAAQIPLPNELYYTQWLKVVGGLVWFTVAWTGWRRLEPAVRAVPGRQVAVGVLAGLTLLIATASLWGASAAVDFPLSKQGEQVRQLMADLDGQLPRDQVILVVRRGEFFHVYGAGVMEHLIEEGYDVVTDEGRTGLKWGHDHRWRQGDPYDLVVTVALNQANDRCAQNPEARVLASYDGLSPEDRAWLTEVQYRRLVEGPGGVTDAERRHAASLAPDDLRLGVFASAAPCTSDPPRDIERTADSSILPVGGGAAVVAAAAVGGRYVVRRRRRRSAGAEDGETTAPPAEGGSSPPGGHPEPDG